MNRIVHSKAELLAFAAAVADKWDWSKPLVVKLEELRRKEILSRKFHAMCTDMAKQITYDGLKLVKSQWKHLMVSGHTYATQEEVQLIRGIEGELINIRESTASMTNERISSLISYAQAYGDVHGVRFTADKYYDSLPEAQC